MDCPCGSGEYETCCGAFHDGAVAPTAEALMRSRYSAYALGATKGDLERYLLDTWHIDNRPAGITFNPGQRWVALTIFDTDGGLALDATGSVEFSAAYEDDSGPHVLHENSRFVRDGLRWLYVDGEATLDGPDL